MSRASMCWEDRPAGSHSTACFENSATSTNGLCGVVQPLRRALSPSNNSHLGGTDPLHIALWNDLAPFSLFFVSNLHSYYRAIKFTCFVFPSPFKLFTAKLQLFMECLG